MATSDSTGKRASSQCARCGKQFTFYPSQGPGRYCSRECKRLHYQERPDLTAKFINLEGRTFGKLKVVRFDGHIHGKHVAWLVECSCPPKTQFRVSTQNLRTGRTKSCGCLIKDTPKPRMKICTVCGRTLPYTEEFFRKSKNFRWGLTPRCHECSRPILRAHHAAWRRKLKREVLAHYSNGEPRCLCCGESHVEMLTLDHVNNDGKQDRLVRGIGMTFYAKLKRDGYPDGLQTLCFNCNIARAFFGKCPHQT